MNKIIEIIDSDDDNQTTIDTASYVPAETLSNNMELDDNPQLQSRRRRRKSVLHAMTDPDMQFQTIAVDDDEDDDEVDNPNNTIQINYQQTIKPNAAAVRPIVKNQKIAPNILTSKSSAEDTLETAYEKFLNDPETISDIYTIAEERTRINYLLSLNGMPEISFTLYTRPDRLQFQFEERLKQRKLLQTRENAKVQENRRTLLQNSTDQNVQ